MPRGLVVLGWMVLTGIVVTTTFSATDPDPGDGFTRSGDLLLEVEAPVLLLPEPDGGVLLGERSTGRILRVDPDGSLVEEPVATVTVPSGGVGLLGLAFGADDQLYASWIDPDQRLVVGRLGGRSPRPIWRGPTMPSAPAGGHLARLPEGRLVVTVGQIGELDEGEEPGGRLLSLDPEGGPEQEPRVLASGLTNPTAITVDDSGVMWVADDEAADTPQPLLGVSPEGDVATVATLPDEVRALALTLQGESLYACGSTGLLLRYRLEDLDGGAEGEPVATDCALSVAPLEEGLLVYSSHASVRTIRP